MDRNILFHMLRYAHTKVNTSVKSLSYKQAVPIVACKQLEKTALPFCIPIHTHICV